MAVDPSKNVRLQLGITPKAFGFTMTERENGVETLGGIGGFGGKILVAAGVTVTA
jgi:hypothetical protein